MRAAIVLLCVLANLGGEIAVAGDHRACRKFRGDVFIACVARTMPASPTCGDETAVPRVEVRPAAIAFADGRQQFEAVVDNVTERRIAFVAFAGRSPDFLIERRRDDGWKNVPWSGCGNALDTLGEGHLRPHRRAVFLLEHHRTRGGPFRVGLDFWFPRGERCTVWSAETWSAPR
jgi:hypothetical protein